MSRLLPHTLLLPAVWALTLTQGPQKKKAMWNQLGAQWCGLPRVSRGCPHPSEDQMLSRGLRRPPPIAGCVHPWVNRSGSSEELRLQEETAVRATNWKQKYGSSRGFDLQFSFCKEWRFFFFFFKKHWTSLNFRPFTNIFLGQKRRKKTPTKCLSQLLTSTMNHGHKTTAMWLTKKLCVFTSRYWKSFSNLCYVICRQTDGCTDTPL